MPGTGTREALAVCLDRPPHTVQQRGPQADPGAERWLSHQDALSCV